MACKLCGAADHRKANNFSNLNWHPIFDCPSWARVPQTVKDSIRELRDANPSNIAPDKLSEWIYNNIYSPGAANHSVWTSWYSKHFTTEEALLRIDERIYIAARSTSLIKMWNLLVPIFEANDNEIAQAKHCAVGIADNRPDAIVIYLTHKAAAWRVCDQLKAWIYEAKLSVTDFRDATPPATGRVPDLPGVAMAAQPKDHGLSFGSQLAKLLAEEFNSTCRPPNKPSTIDFTVNCLIRLRGAGINILAPWIRPPQTF